MDGALGATGPTGADGAGSLVIAADREIFVPAEFPTPQDALDYLSGYTIDDSVTVTITITASATFTTPIRVVHRNASRIEIQGDATKPTLTFNNSNGFDITYGTQLKSLYRLNLVGTMSSSGRRGINVEPNASAQISDVDVSGFSTGIAIFGSYAIINDVLASNTYADIVLNMGGSCAASSFTSSQRVAVEARSSLSINGASSLQYLTCVGGYVVAYAGTLNNMEASDGCFIDAVSATVTGSMNPAANTVGNGNAYIKRP